MDTIEILLLIAGIILTLFGYIYAKIGTNSKPKIPSGYTESLGICKKHVEKKGQFIARFEIAQDGKTLKYDSMPEDTEDKLPAVDAIEKFYVDADGTVLPAQEFGGEKGKAEDKKRLHTSYVIMGAGLVCLIITVVKLAFSL